MRKYSLTTFEHQFKVLSLTDSFASRVNKSTQETKSKAFRQDYANRLAEAILEQRGVFYKDKASRRIKILLNHFYVLSLFLLFSVLLLGFDSLLFPHLKVNFFFFNDRFDSPLILSMSECSPL